VDSAAECDQLNLAHETETKYASANLVQYAGSRAAKVVRSSRI